MRYSNSECQLVFEPECSGALERMELPPSRAYSHYKRNCDIPRRFPACSFLGFRPPNLSLESLSLLRSERRSAQRTEQGTESEIERRDRTSIRVFGAISNRQGAIVGVMSRKKGQKRNEVDTGPQFPVSYTPYHQREMHLEHFDRCRDGKRVFYRCRGGWPLLDPRRIGFWNPDIRAREVCVVRYHASH